jgi:hypothetical protein
MDLRRLLIAMLLIMTLSSARTKAVTLDCKQEISANCAANLHNYPLFDTEYKLAANYLPILALRGLANAELYKDKKSAHLERYFYIKDLQGNFSKPYETIVLDIQVKGHGIIGREVIATGKLNEFTLEYKNKMGFSLPRNARMDVSARLDGISILDLDIKSDGTLMTNTVLGSFLNQDVNYQTKHRDTSGLLSGHKYTLHTEGIDQESDHFTVRTLGKIGSSTIYGKGGIVSPNYYQFEENYGPVLVKTKLTIKP